MTETDLIFSIDTGCPPFPFEVTVMIIRGMFSLPFSFMNKFNFSISIFPLNGNGFELAVLPSSIIKSIGIEPAISECPLKLSK